MSRSAKDIFIGNLLLIVCCVFYLLWWTFAFRPTNPVKGFRSGWLLIPALIVGIMGAALAVRGISHAETVRTFCSGRSVFIAAVVVYGVLLVGTWVLFKRPVTTELILIVAWTALMVSEVNVIYGMNICRYPMTMVFIVGLIVVALVSLAAYLVYYKLDTMAGFIDGMLPLILTAVSMAAIDIGVFIRI